MRVGRAIVVHIARALAIAAVSLLLLPYVLVPVYMFHARTPFAGAALFNPYAGLQPHWQRANFHAHARAWAGITSGQQSPDEIRTAYRAKGYDVVGLSNYHQITRASNDSAFLPVYEHGFSIRKTHQLIIGATHITALDFPLWQTTQAKQYLLARLHDTASLTAVAHPYLRNGYGQSQLAELSGFDLLEVRSHWNDASAWWDSTLTAGNPVWAIGSDDSHDIRKPKEFGVVWTMVNAATNAPADILRALRHGRMYVVAGTGNGAPPRLESMTVRGDTITAQFNQPMERVRVITDGGLVRMQREGSIDITYIVTPADRYARIVATAAGGTLYLNPVIRAAGTPTPWGVPPTRALASIVTRLSAALIWLCCVFVLLPKRLERRRRVRGHGFGDGAGISRVAVLLLILCAPAGLRAQTASSRLPFRIGEYNEYDLKFGVLSVGSGSLSVSGPDTLRGREVMRLRYEIKGGVPLFRVHDVMESWFDAANMLSMRFTQELNEGSRHYTRQFDFYPDESIVLERGRDRSPTVPQPLDDASFIFFVRSLTLDVGQTLSFNRYFRPEANPVTIKVLRKESITVPAGTFNTIVVKPIIRTGGIFSEGGQAELWLSDDANHTLIQMKAKLSFGSLSLYLRPSRNRR
jgi:hypothetical protein